MIKYHIGDATQPIGNGHRIIVHICNNAGGWGAGFVLALSKRWPEPENEYRRWAAGDFKAVPFELGQVQFVSVESDGNPLGDSISVLNMIAQDGYTKPGQPAIRYDALRTCLESANRLITTGLFPNASIHMPRIGCGLAGGKWEEVEKIINETFDEQVIINVYDF